MLHLKEKNLGKLILIGDRILIKPTTPTQKTDSGLYLPQGMHKNEELSTGYIIKVGPGYPIPIPQEEDEQWKDKVETIKYLPLQPKEGDLAVYQQHTVHELVFNGETFVIAPYKSILMVVREPL